MWKMKRSPGSRQALPPGTIALARQLARLDGHDEEMDRLLEADDDSADLWQTYANKAVKVRLGLAHAGFDIVKREDQ